MARFTAHTAVHGEQGTVFFEPGDTVPDWAAEKVGDHVTDGGKASTTKASTAPAGDAEENETATAADKTEAPDFTTPKPRQTRTRRK